MKTLRPVLILALGLAAATPVAVQAGCEILLYPLARAFGSPSESELVLCRAAFARLQATFPTARRQVAPVWRPIMCDAAVLEPCWRPDLAARLATAIGGPDGRVSVLSVAPAVAPMPLPHNQLRYLWQRARAYAAWVQAAPPPSADYILCVELLGQDDFTYAVQVCLLDARGQIAYCRLYNSHQFGRPPIDCEEAVALIVRRLRADLAREPGQIFHPYGIG